MIKVVFIINSTRKLSSFARDVICLAEHSDKLIVTNCKTEFKNHAKELAFTESNKNDIIIAVGGDGTCSEVVNGIYESGLKNVVFGIVPNGSGNDFYRMLTHSSSEDFVHRLENKISTPISFGALEFKNSNAVFLNISDLGFGVKVVDLMNKQRILGIKGKLSYALAIIRSFVTYKKINISIKGDDFTHNGNVLMAAFCNGTTFGHGIVINPMANLKSNLIDVTIIGNVSLLTYIKYLGKLKKGVKIEHPQVQYYQSKQIEILKLNAKQKIEADGEILGTNIQRISVMNNSILLANKVKTVTN